MDKEKMQHLLELSRLLRQFSLEELPAVRARYLPQRPGHYKDHFPRKRDQSDSDRRYHGIGYEQ